MAKRSKKYSDILDVAFQADGKVRLIVGNLRLPLPRRKPVRIALGLFIAIIGLLPILPISFIGVIILSVDVPWLATARQRIVAYIAALRTGLRRRRAAKRRAKNAPEPVLALSNGDARQ